MNSRAFAVTILAALLAALTGCSREGVGERLTRECGEIVGAATSPEDSTNASTATVQHWDILTVIYEGNGREREKWATTPLRKALLTVKEGDAVKFARENYPDEYSAAWRKAFERDLPRREERRAKLIRECVWQRGTKR